MTSNSEYFKCYLSTESLHEDPDRDNIVVGMDEFRKNPDFTKSASILFDAVMTVFKPITHTMSNLKSRMQFTFPSFNEKYMRFEMNDVNHLRYEKQGSLDNIAKAKELIDKIKDKTEKEFTDILTQLNTKQIEYFTKFNSIKDSDIIARDEECKLQNEYYNSRKRYLYIIIEKNTKICPFILPNILANTTSKRLEALSMSSIHIRSIITFLRTSTPSSPIQKSAEPSHK